MVSGLRMLFIIFMALLYAPWSTAQNSSPPWLQVKASQKPIALTHVDIRAEIWGHLSRTTYTLTFYNPNDSVLEGQLNFPLPEGAFISDFALDIRGTLVDGVVVEKHRARQVFESEVRKGIDPGLAEQTQGHHFRTRIYPFMPQSSRTVRLSYLSEVMRDAEGDLYFLPLQFKDKNIDFHLEVEVLETSNIPIVKSGSVELHFEKAWDRGWRAEFQSKGKAVVGDLYLRLPQSKALSQVIVEASKDGSYYVAIRDFLDEPPSPLQVDPKHIAMVWDASGSRQGNHQKSMDFLEAYSKALQHPVEVDFFWLRNHSEFQGHYTLPQEWPALKKTIEQAIYDGGTQLGALDEVIQSLKNLDYVLLFSDGISNYGKESPLQWQVPIYPINDQSTAEYAFLKYLAIQSGGVEINLVQTDLPSALRKIGQQAFSLIRISVQGSGKIEGYPQRTDVDRALNWAGRWNGDPITLVFEYGYGGQVKVTHRYQIFGKKAKKSEFIRTYWANKKAASLEIFPQKNALALIELGKHYRIATVGTSWLVLENLEQYLEYDIRPPDSLAELQKAWDERIQNRRKIQEEAQKDQFQRVLEMWNEWIQWYERDFHYPPDFKYKARMEKKEASRRLGAAPPTSAEAPTLEAEEAAPERDEEPSPHRASKAKRAKKDKAPTQNQISIQLTPWNPQTPYLQTLKQVPESKRYATYLKFKERYGRAPSFYLDCSDFFFNHGSTKLGLRILSNIAELELEEVTLIRVLAHRLQQLKHYDEAILAFEKALKLRPDEPQSYRDLALCLAERAKSNASKTDYQKALELLAHVILNPWERFEGIQVIALVEYNWILPKAKALGLKQELLDPRLIKDLNMDLWVVMTWDADLTDMDLHVIEPSGEEAFFGHQHTTIGGFVSRDFTRGYGPEIYFLRRAMKGKYQVKTHYYGSASAKLIGAVTLQVNVFRNFGRSNESKDAMTLRLKEAKDDFVVGTIVVQ